MASTNTNTPQSDEEWRVRLTPEQFRVLRKKGTERPFTGEYCDTKDEGIYRCAGCDAALYSYDAKFESGCGWPAFFASIPGAVEEHEDTSFGIRRVEIVCKNCSGHLGHVFRGERHNTPTDERHCVNSISLRLDKTSKADL